MSKGAAVDTLMNVLAVVGALLVVAIGIWLFLQTEHAIYRNIDTKHAPPPPPEVHIRFRVGNGPPAQ